MKFSRDTEISFGKYKGELPGAVLIKDPDYVEWVLGKKDAHGSLKELRGEFIRLIKIFDSADFETICEASKCMQKATRCTAYRHNYASLHWWCDECDPYSSGASQGKLRELRSYMGALRYLRSERLRSKKDKETLIRKLAQDKGIGKRLTKKAVQDFFWS